MIDLAKEVKEEFEKLAKENDMPINEYWCDDGTYSQYEHHKTSDAYNFYRDGWNKRAELAQAEITELKQKLARYENPDYVLVPREPTKEIVNHLEDSMAEIILKDDEDFIEAYKAMIEAMEKDHE